MAEKLDAKDWTEVVNRFGGGSAPEPFDMNQGDLSEALLKKLDLATAATDDQADDDQLVDRTDPGYSARAVSGGETSGRPSSDFGRGEDGGGRTAHFDGD